MCKCVEKKKEKRNCDLRQKLAVKRKYGEIEISPELSKTPRFTKTMATQELFNVRRKKLTMGNPLRHPVNQGP